MSQFDSQAFTNALREVLGLEPLYGPEEKIVCWQAWPLMEDVEEVMSLETMIDKAHWKEFYKIRNVGRQRVKKRHLY